MESVENSEAFLDMTNNFHQEIDTIFKRYFTQHFLEIGTTSNLKPVYLYFSFFV